MKLDKEQLERFLVKQRPIASQALEKAIGRDWEMACMGDHFSEILGLMAGAYEVGVEDAEAQVMKAFQVIESALSSTEDVFNGMKDRTIN